MNITIKNCNIEKLKNLSGGTVIYVENDYCLVSYTEGDTCDGIEVMRLTDGMILVYSPNTEVHVVKSATVLIDGSPICGE